MLFCLPCKLCAGYRRKLHIDITEDICHQTNPRICIQRNRFRAELTETARNAALQCIEMLICRIQIDRRNCYREKDSALPSVLPLLNSVMQDTVEVLPHLIQPVFRRLQQKTLFKILAVDRGIDQRQLKRSHTVKTVQQTDIMPDHLPLLIFRQCRVIHVRYRVGFTVQIEELAPDPHLAAQQTDVIGDKALIRHRVEDRPLHLTARLRLILLLCLLLRCGSFSVPFPRRFLFRLCFLKQTQCVPPPVRSYSPFWILCSIISSSIISSCR